MHENLNKELQKSYASCISLQILRIDLPKNYEDSIVATQVEVQKTNMRKFEQKAELIRQNISVIISEADQNINVINSKGLAEAYRLKQFAIANNTRNVIDTETEMYKQLQNEVGIKGDDMPEYLFLSSLSRKENAKLLVGLQNSIISLGGGDNLNGVNSPNSTTRGQALGNPSNDPTHTYLRGDKYDN